MPDFSESFTVDSALLKELGERLVSTPHVALAELVKNSYDADANIVTVSIKTGKDGDPIIEVSDDGSGMTLEQIKNFWMRIGTTHKDDEKVSRRYGRPLTGSKGVGRFCVRRLGSKVKVVSAALKNGKVEKTTFNIDWSKFVPGSEVAQIQVSGTHESVSSGPTGLTLTMSGGEPIIWHEIEDKRSYNYLLRQLATLSAAREVHRKSFEPDPGFNAFLDAPKLEPDAEMQRILGNYGINKAVDLRERLMNAGWALLTAHVTDKGQIFCELDANHPVGRQEHVSPPKLKVLRGATLRLAIFVEESSWNREESLVPIGKLNGILKDWGGVQLKYKGVRIYPYGDPDDDWLGIERDRARRLGRSSFDDILDVANTLRARSPLFDPGRSLLNMLSGKNYLGGVEVNEHVDGLEVRIDRQGFVKGTAVDEIRAFARYSIDWAMIWRDFAVRERERAETDRRRKDLERLNGGTEIPRVQQSAAAFKVFRDTVTALKSNPSTISRQEIESLSTATALLESEFKTNKSDLLRFQLVASAATLTLLYHHEIRYLRLSLNNLDTELDSASTDLPEPIATRCRLTRDMVRNSSQRLDALDDLTQDMGILDRRANAERFDLKDAVTEASARFERVCLNYNIVISKKIAEGIQVGPMLKGELAAILLNGISNGIKAVIAKGNESPSIELYGYRSGTKICLDINDNGIGISGVDQENVFSPLVSDPSGQLYDALEERLAVEDRFLLGQGSGIGLTIVRAILENRKGCAEFVTPKNGWATCLHIEFNSPK
jgi:signal transduction histidine kinase